MRHYKRAELHALLARHFGDVRVVYGVATGKNHLRGLRPIDPRRPLQAFDMTFANLRNNRESRGVEERAHDTAHLFATVRKR